MANCKLPYKLVEHKVYEDCTNKYTYAKIKELSEDEDHAYFFIIDASISEFMIEKNPATKYLPFFPVKINEKSTKKSEFMKAQCEKHKLSDVDTFKLATVLDKTEKYMVHINSLTWGPKMKIFHSKPQDHMINFVSLERRKCGKYYVC